MSEENKKDYQIDEVEQHIDDRDYMLQAIENDATWVLAYASEKLKEDKELMMKCAEKDGQILYYASEKLRDEHTGAETNENLMAKFIIAATFPAKKNTITIATATVTIIHILKCEVLTSFCFIINLRHSALARE